MFDIHIKCSGDKSFEEYCRKRIIEICLLLKKNQQVLRILRFEDIKEIEVNNQLVEKEKEKKKKRKCAKKKRSLMKRIIIFNWPESLTNNQKL